MNMKKSFSVVACSMLLMMACTGQKGAAQGERVVQKMRWLPTQRLQRLTHWCSRVWCIKTLCLIK